MKQEKGAFAAVEIPVEMLEAIVKDARICRDAFELAAASYDGAMAERAQEKYEALCLVCGVIGLPVPSMAA